MSIIEFDPTAVAPLAELPDWDAGQWTVADPSFADWCTNQPESLLPVHRWRIP